MKLKFKILNKEKLAEFIFDLKDTLNKEDIEKNENPFDCIYINFSKDLIKEILSTKKLNKKIKKKIIKEIKYQEKELINDRKKLKKIENYWKEIENLFFSEMQKYFGKNSIKKTYLCYITKKIVSGYFKKNEITLNTKKENESSFIIAEEILHLIYWRFWEKIFNKKIEDKIYEGSSWSPWNISEIIPEYLLIENPNFNKFYWHKQKRPYPFIKNLRKILDPIWTNKKNMEDFIIKSQKEINKINRLKSNPK